MRAVAKLLHRHKDIFSLSEHDLGRTKLIKYHVDTCNARPIKQRASPSKHVEIERIGGFIAARYHQEVKQPVVVPCSVADEKGWLSDSV